MRTKMKQVLLVRTDLDMSMGKVGAQCAHASRQVIIETTGLMDSEEFKEWQEDSYKTVCLAVKSLKDLEKYYNKAIEAGLPAKMIVDNGWTCFNDVKTPTVVAIGPAKSDKIDTITKRLRLL